MQNINAILLKNPYVFGIITLKMYVTIVERGDKFVRKKQILLHRKGVLHMRCTH